MNERSTRHRCRWRIVLVVVLAVLYTAYRVTLHLMVGAKLNEIHRQGYPVTFAELKKWYPYVSKEENADTLFEQARLSFPLLEQNRLKALNHDGFLTLPRTEPLSAATKEVIGQYLATNKAPLELYHKGAGMKRCYYPYQRVGYVNMGVVLSPHLGLRLLRIEAIYRAVDGDTEQATRAVTDSLSLAGTIIEAPHALLYLQGITAASFGIGTLELVLSRVALGDPQLDEVAAALHEVDKPQALTRALVGQRCDLIDDLSDASAVPRLAQVSGTRQVLLLASLWPLDRFVEVSQMPTATQAEFALGRKSLPGDRVVFLQCPKHKPTLTADLDFNGRLHAALSAIAIERYRLTAGDLPDSLEKLLPACLTAVPADPFDGQPLRYKKLAKGYVVYSVGEDGKDDGGDEKKDITFTVER